MSAQYTIAPDGRSITCHTCGMTSYNLNDVQEKYCGNCHVWHHGWYGFPSKEAYQAHYSNFESWAHEIPAMIAYSQEAARECLMSKQQMLKLIDDYKNKLINPVEMLNWTWVRVFIAQIPDDEFDKYMIQASEVLS